eukprot:jgi/Psemu1/193301/e_gw1.139.91.1
MAYNSHSGSFDFHRVSEEAYSRIVDALSKDMPLIMHGCGDVPMRDVNPESARILARLTANYISHLVEAACDSQEILNDGHRPPLPPPPLVSKERRRRAPLPAAYEWPPSKKKRKRRDIDYWDDPLPEPKIKNQPAVDPAVLAAEQGEIVFQGVPIGDWVGVAGVDLFEDSRVRSAHVALPAAIGTQNFVFPVCHDQHLYGKVREIQATLRSMKPVLTDSVVLDAIVAETDLPGSLVGSSRKRRRREEKRNKEGIGAGDATDMDDEDPEASDSEDEYSSRRRPVWPGLDELLPMHTTLDFFGT